MALGNTNKAKEGGREGRLMAYDLNNDCSGAAWDQTDTVCNKYFKDFTSQ